MKSRQARHLFATRRDLEPGVIEIEGRRELLFVDCSGGDIAAPIRFDSLLAVADLGVNRAGNHLLPAFLVLPRNAPVHVQSVAQRRGGMRQVLDQLGNPGSILFQPGGVFADECLVAGHVGTVHSDPPAQALLRDFWRALTKDFKKVRSFWLGRAVN